MGTDLSLNDLMHYTDWEHRKWHEWVRQHGAEVLKISAGPNGDGRFKSVGDLMKHMFSAEKRYIDRLSGRPLSDPASIPSDDVEALFRFGQQSRQDLREFVETFPAEKWDVAQEHKLMNSVLTVTPRKIVVHVLLHEIRHWAQIATLFRLHGLTDDFHDFLFSPVLGGGIRREQGSAITPRAN
jgi:uncharacterized damage-inducible protein DinB